MDVVSTQIAEDATQTLIDPQFLESLRSQMLKFALAHLKDRSSAEDAVQDALVGALKNVDSFSRQSALKTWVFAILKNKIVDYIRKHQRHEEHFSSDDDNDLDRFDSMGHWQAGSKPSSWHQPMEQVKSEQFWRVFEACLDRLPPTQARTFMMREFLELESDEICATLSMTVSNLHVQLYRARMKLRDCLETRWFVKGDEHEL